MSDHPFEGAEVIVGGPGAGELLGMAVHSCWLHVKPVLNKAIKESEGHTGDTYPVVVIPQLGCDNPHPMVFHNEHSLTQCQSAVGGLIDIVSIAVADKETFVYEDDVPTKAKIEMVVHDEALLKSNPVINPVASALAGQLIFGQAILIPTPGHYGKPREE